MAKNYYSSGLWNIYCDVCAKKIKADQAKKRWDGLIVCPEDFEERQPQDFVKARLDKISVPFARPSAPNPFSFPIGWQDILKTTEKYNVGKILAPIDVVELLIASEVVTVYRAAAAVEFITVSEVMSYIVQTDLPLSDLLSTLESGAVCKLDYVDPTYFAEIYVGTCSDFSV